MTIWHRDAFKDSEYLTSTSYFLELAHRKLMPIAQFTLVCGVGSMMAGSLLWVSEHEHPEALNNVLGIKLLEVGGALALVSLVGIFVLNLLHGHPSKGKPGLF